FGFARVVRLKDALPSQPRKEYPTKSRKVVDGVERGEELLPREMAVQVAKGRKAKQLKRKAVEGGTAKALKVRRCDLVDIEVTEEEVDAVFNELLLSKKTPSPYFDGWIVPLFETEDDLYEVVESPHFADDLMFRRRLCVFRDLWRRGYYLTNGFKFGCDYLLYENKPSLVHSKFMVKCVDASSCIRPLDMAVLSRLSSQVNKLILFAIVSSDSPFPYYLQCSWWN
uniref:tRNA-intron lyase n=1 Tax=Parascaris univalens TaxID=6257 RepID=A0A915A7Q4_PARUN